VVLLVRVHSAFFSYYKLVRRDSAFGVTTSYWLDDRGVGVRVPVGQEFSLLRVVQTGSGPPNLLSNG
jgi:hypothetical protein